MIAIFDGSRFAEADGTLMGSRTRRGEGLAHTRELFPAVIISATYSPWTPSAVGVRIRLIDYQGGVCIRCLRNTTVARPRLGCT